MCCVHFREARWASCTVLLVENKDTCFQETGEISCVKRLGFFSWTKHLIFVNKDQFTNIFGKSSKTALSELRSIRMKMSRSNPYHLRPWNVQNFRNVILMKMTLICVKMKLHAELIFTLILFLDKGTRKLSPLTAKARITSPSSTYLCSLPSLPEFCMTSWITDRTLQDHPFSSIIWTRNPNIAFCLFSSPIPWLFHKLKPKENIIHTL